MSKTRLAAQHLCYTHPGSDWTLSVPEFALPPSQFRAILGPNGSGKSTFLRLLAGILTPQEGEIWINQQRLSSISRRDLARSLAYLPSETRNEFDFTVQEIVSMGRYAHLGRGGFMKAADFDAVRRAMEITDVTPFHARRLSHLSAGERQRTFLASILAQDPEMILLDEPTNALDMHHQVKLFHILNDLAHRGISVLMVLHDMNMASLYCDQISFFQAGRIVREGTPDKVLQPEFLAQVYEEPVLLLKHPLTHRPLLFPHGQGGEA